MQDQENAAIATLQLAGIKCSSLEELFLAQTTPDDDELNLMAATLAYFKVIQVIVMLGYVYPDPL